MRITESQLRKIVRQEAKRLLEADVKGATFVQDPSGKWVPSGGMSDWEGPGAQMAADVRRPKIKGMKKLGAAPKPDTLLIYIGHRDDEGYSDGMMYFYIGTRDQVEDFVARGGVDRLPDVEIEGDWEAEANGGPSPVAEWLKRNPSIRFVLDQQVELGDEIMTAKEYIQMKEDDMDPDWDQAAWDRENY